MMYHGLLGTVIFIYFPVIRKGGFLLGLHHQLHEFSVSHFTSKYVLSFKGNELDIAEPNIGNQP